MPGGAPPGTGGAGHAPRCPLASWEQPVVTLGELVMILDLARQGLTVSAIARRTGHDRKTIRNYIARGLEPPAYKPREPAPVAARPLRGLPARTGRPLSRPDRPAPLARGPRPRLRRRLLHRHRLPARGPPACRAGRLRAAFRDPAGAPGAGRLRPLQGRASRTSLVPSASSGCSPSCSATAA